MMKKQKKNFFFLFIPFSFRFNLVNSEWQKKQASAFVGMNKKKQEKKLMIHSFPDDDDDVQFNWKKY